MKPGTPCPIALVSGVHLHPTVFHRPLHPSPAADARAGARGGGGAARHQNRALLPHPQLPAGHLWQRHAGKPYWLLIMCSLVVDHCATWLPVMCSLVVDCAPPVRLVTCSQLASGAHSLPCCAALCRAEPCCDPPAWSPAPQTTSLRSSSPWFGHGQTCLTFRQRHWQQAASRAWRSLSPAL